jgi:hypothetical protein
MRFGRSALLLLFISARPIAGRGVNFYFRCEPETAINAACGESGWGGAHNAPNAAKRLRGQQLPQAQKPTCALFPYSKKCLPPFEASRLKALLPLLFLCHHACPPPDCMMAGPVARSDGMDRKITVDAEKVSSVRKRCLPISTPRQRRFSKRKNTAFCPKVQVG